jgi:RNA polymerase sigma factor (sigma-70 family)
MLVREGYEAAFEEIVRRYGRPLGRYAASIVGGHSEDVLQDAFAKALPALRRDDAEVDLRPWLFRIVRNTALNDLRDSPPSPEALAETLAGGRNPAEELEAREQLADLMRRLQALPEAQRAAIVMRELEGLGHEEIAAALGLSDGGARQAIYRARRALRDSAGMLLPLPLLRLLIDHGTEAAGASAGAGGALAAAGASAGGAGAGGALKAGVVAVVVAGSVGAGVAVQEHRAGNADTAKASGAALRPAPPAGSSPASPTGLALAAQRVGGSHSGDDRHGEGRDAPGSTGKDSSGHERNGAADRTVAVPRTGAGTTRTSTAASGPRTSTASRLARHAPSNTAGTPVQIGTETTVRSRIATETTITAGLGAAGTTASSGRAAALARATRTRPPPRKSRLSNRTNVQKMTKRIVILSINPGCQGRSVFLHTRSVFLHTEPRRQ